MNVLFSTGCPKCQVLKTILTQCHIPFEVCTSIEDMQKLGLMTAPALRTADGLLLFEDAVKWARAHDGGKE